MSDELEPCPFCGGEAYITDFGPSWGESRFELRINHTNKCIAAQAKVFCGPTRAGLITAWNHRIGVAAAKTRVAELEQWKAAIDKALVCNHLGTADDFPSATAALQRLIDWEISMALDPKISAEARSLQAEATAKLEAENARLREALVKEREENLWRAYGTGYKSYGRWTHMGLADGEWLARKCGFDPTLSDYDADEIEAAIPKVALKVLEEIQQNNE
jgi:hypothetical protein